jgi:hypothetical protein
VQKVLHSSKGNRFHGGGLNEIESLELLALEELLPIEALMSFHLLALRNAYKSQMKNDAKTEDNPRRNGNYCLHQTRTKQNLASADFVKPLAELEARAS